MRAFVVGGAGFTGSHLTERLLADGCAVDVVDDLSSGTLANLATARAMGAELTIHTLDLRAAEFAALAALRRPEVIYYLAGPTSQAAPPLAMASLASVVALLEAARPIGSTKLVTTIPATALYGDVPLRDLPVKEGHPWQADGVGGILARSTADLLTWYRNAHAVEYTALAMGCVYGPRQRSDAGVVASFLEARRTGEPPVIHGDGRQTRDFVYIDDAVDALARCATHGGGLVVNIGTGVATSIRDLWGMIADGSSAAPTFVPGRPGGVARSAVSPTRARIHLSWAPWTPLIDGLRSNDR